MPQKAQKLYMYISFNLNNGSFIVDNFLFWNCHIKALDKGDLVLIIFGYCHCVHCALARKNSNFSSYENIVFIGGAIQFW
jgi:hypothetical protein